MPQILRGNSHCIQPFRSVTDMAHPYFSALMKLMMRSENLCKMKELSLPSISPVELCMLTVAIKMENWLLTKEKNHAELLMLHLTRRILPLLTYDLAGNLIRPIAYHHCLQGAIVEVHFTMSYWGYCESKVQCLQRKLTPHIESDDMPAAKTAKICLMDFALYLLEQMSQFSTDFH
ncbi:hypothetical protein EDD15DRAFT_2265779 [Pisolithus albus]|nr:hypothetical protein EDD15DRAFT_2265779 [Pisolithus albus]